MAKFNRGDRLATLERLKEQRKNHWGQRSSTDPMTPKQRGKVAHTPQACSCHMCGNPRKHFKDVTVQERRLFQDLLE